MNRKRMIVEGTVLGILFALGFLLLARWYIERTNKSTEADQSTSVSNLAYCNADQLRPCIVSFSLDIDGNMLVNILLPDLTFPGFYLQIVRGETSVSYVCRRVTATPNNAYCIGEKLPPGEVFHLMLISTRDDTLLAEGNLSIIGLAFPTVGVAIPTSASLTPELTETPDFIIPPTQRVFSTPTGTAPGYPNPSYPWP